MTSTVLRSPSEDISFMKYHGICVSAFQTILHPPSVCLKARAPTALSIRRQKSRRERVYLLHIDRHQQIPIDSKLVRPMQNKQSLSLHTLCWQFATRLL